MGTTGRIEDHYLGFSHIQVHPPLFTKVSNHINKLLQILRRLGKKSDVVSKQEACEFVSITKLQSNTCLVQSICYTIGFQASFLQSKNI